MKKYVVEDRNTLGAYNIERFETLDEALEYAAKGDKRCVYKFMYMFCENKGIGVPNNG